MSLDNTGFTETHGHMPRAASALRGLTISQLRTEFEGRVIAPGDAGYDKARAVFSSAFDRRPAVIIRPANASQVACVVAHARATGLELAIRSGGHSNAGHSTSEGGIVLDLADLRALDVDVQGRTAWAETGLTARDYVLATSAHDLATGFGDTGSVGIGGITVGGGIGFLVRKYGLTIDDVLAADVVTADGELRRADAKNHPDLFWAIRGGGGNFGVVTRIQFRLHELETLVGGLLILPATPDIIASFVDAAEAAPEELSTIANVMPAPPLPFLPAEYHGRLIVMAMVAYAGATQAGERAMAPFRALAKPIVDTVKTVRYPELYPPEPADYHPAATTRSFFVDTIDRRWAETVLEHLRASTAQMAATQIRVLGGAVARVPRDATAYAHRRRRVMVGVTAVYANPADGAMHDAWAEQLADALRPAKDGVYVNFLAEEGAARVREAYPESTWDRLVEVKTRYDPTNLFRLNQNIPPAGDRLGR